MFPIRLDLSRKVAVPTAVLAFSGAALLIAGVLLADGSLKEYGIAALVAAGVAGPVGYSQPHTTDEEPAAKEVLAAGESPPDEGDAGKLEEPKK